MSRHHAFFTHSTGRPSALAKPRQAGLTLLELLLVLGILGITLGWGIPRLDGLMARQAVATDVLRLKEALTTARHTAISRGTIITVCPGQPTRQCGRDWTAPLNILGGEMHRPPAQRVAIGRRQASRLATIHYRDDQRPVRYMADGRASGHNGTFRLCGRRGQGASVVVSNFGRVRVIEQRPADC